MSLYVSVTGFRPSGPFAIPIFWWRTLRSLAQAKRSPGLIHLEAWVANGTYHTMTVWKDQESVRAFMTDGAHKRAMKNFRSLGTGKTYGYSCDAIPRRDAAYQLWSLLGKDV